MSASNESRRAFVKRVAYATPAVLTLAAAPEFAKAGSGKSGGHGYGQDKDRGDRGGGKGRGHGKGKDD